MKFNLFIDPNADEAVTATVHRRSKFTMQLEALIMEYNGSDRLMGYTEEDIKPLNIADVACILVQESKTYAIDRRGNRYRLKQRLYELEQILPGYFIRLSKSALANENHLDRFQASFSGAVDAIFTCGYREYVSRRCFAEIKRRYNEK